MFKQSLHFKDTHSYGPVGGECISHIFYQKGRPSVRVVKVAAWESRMKGMVWLSIMDGTLQETNISPKNGTFEDDFPFPVWWDMLIPWMVIFFLFSHVFFFLNADGRFFVQNLFFIWMLVDLVHLIFLFGWLELNGFLSLRAATAESWKR